MKRNACTKATRTVRLIKYFAGILSLSILIGLLACNHKYSVAYYPLYDYYFAPKARADFIASGFTEVKSMSICVLMIFIDYAPTSKISATDLNNLRVMIINQTSHNELFFTQDGHLISLNKNVRYNFPEIVVNLVIFEYWLRN